MKWEDEELEEIKKNTKKMLDSVGLGGISLSGAVGWVAVLRMLVKKGIITEKELEDVHERVARTCGFLEMSYKQSK